MAKIYAGLACSELETWINKSCDNKSEICEIVTDFDTTARKFELRPVISYKRRPKAPLSYQIYAGRIGQSSERGPWYRQFSCDLSTKLQKCCNFVYAGDLRGRMTEQRPEMSPLILRHVWA